MTSYLNGEEGWPRVTAEFMISLATQGIPTEDDVLKRWVPWVSAPDDPIPYDYQLIKSLNTLYQQYLLAREGQKPVNNKLAGEYIYGETYQELVSGNATKPIVKLLFDILDDPSRYPVLSNIISDDIRLEGILIDENNKVTYYEDVSLLEVLNNKERDPSFSRIYFDKGYMYEVLIVQELNAIANSHSRVVKLDENVLRKLRGLQSQIAEVKSLAKRLGRFKPKSRNKQEQLDEIIDAYDERYNEYTDTTNTMYLSRLHFLKILIDNTASPSVIGKTIDWSTRFYPLEKEYYRIISSPRYHMSVLKYLLSHPDEQFKYPDMTVVKEMLDEMEKTKATVVQRYHKNLSPYQNDTERLLYPPHILEIHMRREKLSDQSSARELVSRITSGDLSPETQDLIMGFLTGQIESDFAVQEFQHKQNVGWIVTKFANEPNRPVRYEYESYERHLRDNPGYLERELQLVKDMDQTRAVLRKKVIRAVVYQRQALNDEHLYQISGRYAGIQALIPQLGELNMQIDDALSFLVEKVSTSDRPRPFRILYEEFTDSQDEVYITRSDFYSIIVALQSLWSNEDIIAEHAEDEVQLEESIDEDDVMPFSHRSYQTLDIEEQLEDEYYDKLYSTKKSEHYIEKVSNLGEIPVQTTIGKYIEHGYAWYGDKLYKRYLLTGERNALYIHSVDVTNELLSTLRKGIEPKELYKHPFNTHEVQGEEMKATIKMVLEELPGRHIANRSPDEERPSTLGHLDMLTEKEIREKSLSTLEEQVSKLRSQVDEYDRLRDIPSPNQEELDRIEELKPRYEYYRLLGKRIKVLKLMKKKPKSEKKSVAVQPSSLTLEEFRSKGREILETNINDLPVFRNYITKELMDAFNIKTNTGDLPTLEGDKKDKALEDPRDNPLFREWWSRVHGKVTVRDKKYIQQVKEQLEREKKTIEAAALNTWMVIRNPKLLIKSLNDKYPGLFDMSAGEILSVLKMDDPIEGYLYNSLITLPPATKNSDLAIRLANSLQKFYTENRVDYEMVLSVIETKRYNQLMKDLESESPFTLSVEVAEMVNLYRKLEAYLKDEELEAFANNCDSKAVKESWELLTQANNEVDDANEQLLALEQQIPNGQIKWQMVQVETKGGNKKVRMPVFIGGSPSEELQQDINNAGTRIELAQKEQINARYAFIKTAEIELETMQNETRVLLAQELKDYDIDLRSVKKDSGVKFVDVAQKVLKQDIKNFKKTALYKEFEEYRKNRMRDLQDSKLGDDDARRYRQILVLEQKLHENTSTVYNYLTKAYSLLSLLGQNPVARSAKYLKSLISSPTFVLSSLDDMTLVELWPEIREYQDDARNILSYQVRMDVDRMVSSFTETVLSITGRAKRYTLGLVDRSGYDGAIERLRTILSNEALCKDTEVVVEVNGELICVDIDQSSLTGDIGNIIEARFRYVSVSA